MKLNEIISSGILEAQYLGLNSKEDQQQVIEMAENDEELNEYLVHLEDEMSSFFQTHEVPPPPAVRHTILEKTSRRELQKAKKEQKQAETGTSGQKYIDIEVNDTYIKVHKYWRPAFIAVFVLSKIFLILGLYYYFKSSSLEKELEQLKPATETVAR